MNGQADYSEATAIIIILFTAFLMYLYYYHFEYFVYIWIWPITAVYYLFKYTPEVITDILFFWKSTSVQQESGLILNYLENAIFGGKEQLPTMHDRFVEIAKSKDKIYIINSYTGSLLNGYVMLFLGWKGWKIYKRKKYTDYHSMDTLAIQESELWPQIKPIIYENPLNTTDLDSGKWAMAKKPEQFVEEYNLSKSYENELGEKRFTLLEDKAFKVFLKQLGNPWQGANKLTKYERQIFAILIAKTSRNSDLSLKLIKDLSTLYTSENTWKIRWRNRKFSKEVDKLVDSTISKYANTEKIENIVNKHFFVKTVLAGLLEEARVDGVLGNSDFLWLKPRQRDLWYMLCNVGRKSAFVEAAGVWSHFLSEKYIGRKVSNPMIKNAVKSLDVYLFESSEIYDPLTKKEEE